jgi:hypothetical protein
MTKLFNNSLLISVGVACLALATTACGGGSGDDDSGNGSGGSSGSGGTGGGGNTTCTPGGNIKLAIDQTGWMDKMTPCNDDVGVNGAWYGYGDAYDVAKCINFGDHPATDCATIAVPDMTMKSFPNEGGVMKTSGHVEQVLACVDGSDASTIGTSGCPTSDFSSMWGAGIGFDLNSSGGDNSVKSTWNPATYGVVGIRFHIGDVPAAGVRVEFPMLLTAEEAQADVPVPVTANPPTTDDHSKGAPYWGAQATGDNKWPKSPITPNATNTVLFATDVQPAVLGVYTFDTSRMLGVQFHVPTNATAGSDYAFEISNFELIRDPNVPPN